MTARKKIGSFMGGAAMIAGALGMTAGLAPPSAAPSQSPGSMPTIVDQNITGAGYSRVIVQGVYPKQKPDAVGYLNNLTAGCGGIHDIVWGDDGNEQYLFDRNYPGVHNDIDGFVRASDRGLEYLQQFVVPASVLNEDKDGTDLVFFRARFVDRDCGSRGFRTSTWSRATSDRTVPVLAQRKALRRTRFTSAAPLRCGEFTDTGPRPNVRGRSGPHHSIRRPACRQESQPVRHSTVTVYPHGEVHGVA